MSKRKYFIFLSITLFTVVVLATAFKFSGFFLYQIDLLTSADRRATQRELVDLIETKPEQAFPRFRQILKDSPMARNSCHGIAHQMGHHAYEAYGFDGAMQYQDGLCGGGYIHGVIEGRFGALQEGDLLGALAGVCSEMPTESCFHGVGHGLMIALDNNTTDALVACDQVIKNGQSDCYDGIFMQIFDDEETGLNKRKALAQRSSDLCAKVDGKYQESCYFYLPRMYKAESSANIVYICEGLVGKNAVVCAMGTGHSFMKYSVGDPEKALAKCGDFKDANEQQACINGGMKYFVFDAMSAGVVAKKVPLCDIFDANNQSACRLEKSKYIP